MEAQGLAVDHPPHCIVIPGPLPPWSGVERTLSSFGVSLRVTEGDMPQPSARAPVTLLVLRREWGLTGRPSGALGSAGC